MNAKAKNLRNNIKAADQFFINLLIEDTGSGGQTSLFLGKRKD